MSDEPSSQPRAARWRRLTLISIGVLLLCLLPPATPVQAATITVNSLADPIPATGSCPGVCTLRNAITAANPGDTIQFGVTGTILVNDALLIEKNLTIEGPGAANLTLDGQNQHMVMDIRDADLVGVRGLTITRGNGGSAGMAGAILNASRNLTISNTVVHGNTVATGGSAIFGTASPTATTVLNSVVSGNTVTVAGSAIDTFGGTLTVINSTVTGNVSPLGGGAISLFGTVATISNSSLDGNQGLAGAITAALSPNLTLRNSTISGNSGTDVGGLLNQGSIVTIVNSTFSGNGSNAGGSIRNVTNAQLPGSVTLRNSIVVNATAGDNCVGTIISAGNNLSDTTACFPGGSQGDIVSATPLLGPLALNAPGTTRTHALLYGSPAIDGVTFNASECPGPNTVITDQRGQPRPEVWAGPRCDIGAYELAANTPPSISGISPQAMNEDGPVPVILVTVDDAETPGSLNVTGSSTNQTLVPNANIAVGSGGLLRTVAVTPAANQFGNTTITLTVSDGFVTASTSYLLTVNPVNDAPVAVNDQYTVGATKLLTVPAGSGLLANDTDVDGPALSAVLEQGPAHGELVLSPNGSFTYQPTPQFAGFVTFTYRASDGVLTSVSPATVTIKVEASPCTPRPVVRSQLTAGGGKLQVRVETTPLADRPAGPLQEIRFGQLQNAKVTLGGQPVASGQSILLPGSTTFVEFTVERLVAGQPTLVPFTAIDECGLWPTFVGGGTSAGF